MSILLLVAGAMFAVISCRKNPRAVQWIVMGILSFCLASYAQMTLHDEYPLAEFFIDFCQAYLLHRFGRYVWEWWLAQVWQVSLSISIIRFFGGIHSEYTYIVMLELCCWAALAVITMGNASWTIIRESSILGRRIKPNSPIHSLMLSICRESSAAWFAKNQT